MKISKNERVAIIKARITKTVTAGGGSAYYDVVCPQKLAEFLEESLTNPNS